MYYVSHAYSDCGRSYVETDLIEAEGEAFDLFLTQCEQDGYASREFVAIDYVTEDDIQLDIVDYIGEDKFKVFEKTLENFTEEDGELTRTKIDSWFIACTMRRKR